MQREIILLNLKKPDDVIQININNLKILQMSEIKILKQKKVDQLLNDCTVFFAFSNEQFEKNKTPLAEGEKYVSIGAGGYMPKSKINLFADGMKEIEKWYKEQGKDAKKRRDHIAYELSNHEAWYTGEIEDTMDALGEGYTRKEVWKVYYHESKKQTVNA